jgi:type II secretory pathway component HofQ
MGPLSERPEGARSSARSTKRLNASHDHNPATTFIGREQVMTISSLILGAFFAAAQLVSIDTKEMDLSDFLRLMAMMGNMNIVIHPAVQGKVNLMVKDAPWEQVLDSVLKNYGLRKEVEGNIMRIAPASVFAAEQHQTAAIEEARLSALPLQTQIYFLNYAKAEDMAVVVSKQLTARGSVVVYRPRNALIIRDVVSPSELLGR